MVAMFSTLAISTKLIAILSTTQYTLSTPGQGTYSDNSG